MDKDTDKVMSTILGELRTLRVDLWDEANAIMKHLENNIAKDEEEASVGQPLSETINAEDLFRKELRELHALHACLGRIHNLCAALIEEIKR
jgi:hypothetical protein